MSTTPNGLPYPVPTAPAKDGADDIKALALALDPRTPKKLMMVRGDYTTDNDGLFLITAPGPVAAASIAYYGIWHPMIVCLHAITGNTVTVAFNRLDGSAIANSLLGVCGVIFHD